MSKQLKLLYAGQLDWKDRQYRLEFYETDDVSSLSPVSNVQAVCFADNDRVVLYRNTEDYWGLPGGGIEPGETIEQALKRELFEEAALQLINFGPIGYIKAWPTNKPQTIGYQLRFWAYVKLLDEPINDPCGKAVGREAFSVAKAVEKLNWGERGRIIVGLAEKRYRRALSGNNRKRLF